MPFNLGQAVYTFHVSGLTQAQGGLRTFQLRLADIKRGNFLAPLNQSFQGLFGTLGGVLSRLGILQSMLGFIGATGATMGVGGAIALAAQEEQTRQSLAFAMKNAKAADELFEQMNRFGADTPLNMPEILQGGKGLIQAKVAAQEIIPTLRAIGDIAYPAKGIEGFTHLAYLYKTFKQQQIITNQDVMQIAQQGIDIYSGLGRAIAKAQGLQRALTTAEVRKMVADHKVGFTEIHNAIKILGDENAGAMEKASRTLIGRFSTLKDIVKVKLFTPLGQKIIDTFHLKDVQERLITFAETFSERFGPRLDAVFLKIKEFRPLLDALGTSVISVGKALLPVAKILGAVALSLAELINRHPALASALIQTIIWTKLANLAFLALGSSVFMIVGQIQSLINILRLLGLTRLAFLGPLAIPLGIAAIAGAAGTSEDERKRKLDERLKTAKDAASAERFRKFAETDTEILAPSQGFRSRGFERSLTDRIMDSRLPKEYESVSAAARAKTTPPGSGMSEITGSGRPTPRGGPPAFVGIAQLAEKMQLEAFQRGQQNDIAKDTAAMALGIGALAGTVSDGRVRTVSDPTSLSGPGGIPTFGRV